MISNLFLVIDPFTAIAVGSAIAGLVGTVASSHMNRKAQRETNAMQLRAQQATNAFNAVEAQKERDWNDYTNQSARMRSAGLNPSLMFGGQGSPVTSGAVASGAGVPGLTSPTFDFGQNQIGSFADIAAAMQSVANAKKAGAETNAIESMLGEQIKDLQLRNEYQSILNTYQGKKSATEIGKMIQDIESQYVEIDNLIKEGKLTEAQTRLTNVQEEIGQENKGLAHADRVLRESLADKREEYTTNILNKQKEEINTTKKQGNMYTQQGKAAVMQGQAALTSATAQAEDLRATRAARINQLNADAREKNSLSAINEYELDTRPSKMIASWHNFVDMVTSTVSATTSVNYLKKELDAIGYEIELAKKHNDWYLVDQLMDNAKDIAISIGSIAIARKNFGSAGKPRPIGFNK